MASSMVMMFPTGFFSRVLPAEVFISALIAFAFRGALGGRYPEFILYCFEIGKLLGYFSVDDGFTGLQHLPKVSVSFCVLHESSGIILGVSYPHPLWKDGDGAGARIPCRIGLQLLFLPGPAPSAGDTPVVLVPGTGTVLGMTGDALDDLSAEVSWEHYLYPVVFGDNVLGVAGPVTHGTFVLPD